MLLHVVPMRVCFVAPTFCWSRHVLHRPRTSENNLKPTLSASDSDRLPDCDCPGPPVQRKGHQSTAGHEKHRNLRGTNLRGNQPIRAGFNSFAANLLQFEEMCSDIFYSDTQGKISIIKIIINIIYPLEWTVAQSASWFRWEFPELTMWFSERA